MDGDSPYDCTNVHLQTKAPWVIQTFCPVCSVNMSECMGKEAPTPEPELHLTAVRKRKARALIFVVLAYWPPDASGITSSLSSQQTHEDYDEAASTRKTLSPRGIR
jgi:hypothetical protein